VATGKVAALIHSSIVLGLCCAASGSVLPAVASAQKPPKVTAVPLPGTGKLRDADTASFTFFVAGDNRPPKADSAQPPTSGLIFAAAKKQKPAFIVWTGDMIYGLDSADPKKIKKQYKEFLDIAKKGDTPVFASPGNHEMDVKFKDPKHAKNDTLIKETGSAAMEALYRANLGLAKDAPIYQAFSYGNSRFILVNTEEVSPQGVVRSRGETVAGGKLNLDPGYVSPTQLAWVKQELDSSAKAKHVFIFMHHPIKPKKATMGLDSASAAALTTLFAKYKNVSYVLASHEHLYYNPQTKDESQPPARDDPSKDGPYYLVSGGAGAPLDKGGFHNYLVVAVKKHHVDVTMVKLP
jgi:3',5'-cyclic AMP phosphodiesterase CpdA